MLQFHHLHKEFLHHIFLLKEFQTLFNGTGFNMELLLRWRSCVFTFLKNHMHSVVPMKKRKMENVDRLPMSNGFDVKQDIVTMDPYHLSLLYYLV